MAAKKPDPWALITAVVLTVFFALAVSVLGFSYAEEAYRQTHNLPPSHFSLLGIHWSKPQSVTFEMLGLQTILLNVVFPAVVYALIHPVIGRVVSGLSHWLGNNLDQVLDVKDIFGNWDANSLVLSGALWPITMCFVLLQVIGLVLCHVYRSLWS